VQGTILGEISAEFEGADIPDWRLRERLLSMAESLDGTPEASLPKAMKTTAAREAAYRFLGNARVTMEGILAPHVRATSQRCRDEEGPIYVLSDTTECAFSGDDRVDKLGRLSGKSGGFLVHLALAVSGSGTPLGVAGIDVIARGEKKPTRNVYQTKRDPTRESLRWGAMVDLVSDVLEGQRPIHVMDSEADIYELLTHLQQTQQRYIIRGGQDRLVDGGHLDDALEAATFVLEREVRLSRRSKSTQRSSSSRRNPPRLGRVANLSVSAMQVSLRRPKTCTAEHPRLLPLNVVRVYETEAPEGEVPVEWILFTSEPVNTVAAVAAVVDGYRRRWLIEEYFKALKTGCSYEKRELESMRTLTNLLGIVAVIAWRLLKLRALLRSTPQRPATEVVDSDLLDALAARLKDIREPKPLPPSPTVTDLMNGIARLGGHITSNGPPGWQVLWRGYQDLLSWGGGFIRGRSITYKDQS
jgi:Transposase DNA-binding/Transposase DDE domain